MRLFARLRVADPAPADRGDIILGWLTKITAVLAVTALLFAMTGLSYARTARWRPIPWRDVLAKVPG